MAPILASMIGSGPLLSTASSRSLVTLVTNKDIMDSLFSIPKDKAPGPDGCSSYFFKKAWNIVGADVLSVVHEFFKKGRLLK